MKLGKNRVDLNYRAVPTSEGNKPLGKWMAWTDLIVMNYSETWYKVWYDNRIVYAHGDYIDLGVDIGQTVIDIASALHAGVDGPTDAPDRPDFSRRVVSQNGKYLIPLFSDVLSSDTAMHLARGSEPAYDITAHPQRLEVYPVADGIVHSVERLAKPTDMGKGKYGENVLINHGDFYCWYCHLEWGSINKLLSPGIEVKQEHFFARIGNTGLTDFPKHIHITMFPSLGNYSRIHPETIWNKSSFFWLPYAKSVDLGKYAL